MATRVQSPSPSSPKSVKFDGSRPQTAFFVPSTGAPLRIPGPGPGDPKGKSSLSQDANSGRYRNKNLPLSPHSTHLTVSQLPTTDRAPCRARPPEAAARLYSRSPKEYIHFRLPVNVRLERQKPLSGAARVPVSSATGVSAPPADEETGTAALFVVSADGKSTEAVQAAHAVPTTRVNWGEEQKTEKLETETSERTGETVEEYSDCSPGANPCALDETMKSSPASLASSRIASRRQSRRRLMAELALTSRAPFPQRTDTDFGMERNISDSPAPSIVFPDVPIKKRLDAWEGRENETLRTVLGNREGWEVFPFASSSSLHRICDLAKEEIHRLLFWKARFPLIDQRDKSLVERTLADVEHEICQEVSRLFLSLRPAGQTTLLIDQTNKKEQDGKPMGVEPKSKVLLEKLHDKETRLQNCERIIQRLREAFAKTKALLYDALIQARKGVQMPLDGLISSIRKAHCAEIEARKEAREEIWGEKGPRPEDEIETQKLRISELEDEVELLRMELKNQVSAAKKMFQRAHDLTNQQKQHISDHQTSRRESQPLSLTDSQNYPANERERGELHGGTETGHDERSLNSKSFVFSQTSSAVFDEKERQENQRERVLLEGKKTELDEREKEVSKREKALEDAKNKEMKEKERRENQTFTFDKGGADTSLQSASRPQLSRRADEETPKTPTSPSEKGRKNSPKLKRRSRKKTSESRPDSPQPDPKSSFYSAEGGIGASKSSIISQVEADLTATEGAGAEESLQLQGRAIEAEAALEETRITLREEREAARRKEELFGAVMEIFGATTSYLHTECTRDPNGTDLAVIEDDEIPKEKADPHCPLAPLHPDGRRNRDLVRVALRLLEKPHLKSVLLDLFKDGDDLSSTRRRSSLFMDLGGFQGLEPAKVPPPVPGEDKTTQTERVGWDPSTSMGDESDAGGAWKRMSGVRYSILNRGFTVDRGPKDDWRGEALTSLELVDKKKAKKKDKKKKKKKAKARKKKKQGGDSSDSDSKEGEADAQRGQEKETAPPFSQEKEVQMDEGSNALSVSHGSDSGGSSASATRRRNSCRRLALRRLLSRIRVKHRWRRSRHLDVWAAQFKAKLMKEAHTLPRPPGIGYHSTCFSPPGSPFHGSQEAAESRAQSPSRYGGQENHLQTPNTRSQRGSPTRTSIPFGGLPRTRSPSPSPPPCRGGGDFTRSTTPRCGPPRYVQRQTESFPFSIVSFSPAHTAETTATRYTPSGSRPFSSRQTTVHRDVSSAAAAHGIPVDDAYRYEIFRPRETPASRVGRGETCGIAVTPVGTPGVPVGGGRFHRMRPRTAIGTPGTQQASSSSASGPKGRRLIYAGPLHKPFRRPGSPLQSKEGGEGDGMIPDRPATSFERHSTELDRIIQKADFPTEDYYQRLDATKALTYRKPMPAEDLRAYALQVAAEEAALSLQSNSSFPRRPPLGCFLEERRPSTLTVGRKRIPSATPAGGGRETQAHHQKKGKEGDGQGRRAGGTQRGSDQTPTQEQALNLQKAAAEHLRQLFEPVAAAAAAKLAAATEDSSHFLAVQTGGVGGGGSSKAVAHASVLPSSLGSASSLPLGKLSGGSVDRDLMEEGPGRGQSSALKSKSSLKESSFRGLPSSRGAVRVPVSVTVSEWEEKPPPQN
uniref:Uncharacterized protein n=1 Tax=Chromera velia CCMP2878 TaxID=1169474 RepID=A0A0G4I3S2_9ALVE|eukprot:Cvel_10745.t1-p1 / transcript=Cvel_10745.t1 / gene=Cvel_10745 / organism=Chromera_velia_CCMP2878 / gene_product=hypothetical protein / transcript_product=hypothetical protein / location=Cvel_scaffold655:40852-49846(+) / protein_length=1634 / sequence_SO=supercontig / SO=protein_coding / is_pseudo=false